MKRIHYLLAFVVAAAAFSACKPLNKAYDTLGDVPAPVAPVVIAPTFASYTLTAADYASLPATNPANTAGFFHGTTDAFASIPAILAKKYTGLGDKSQITVTYATSPLVPAIKVADSVNADVAYSLLTTNVPDDYKFSAFTYKGATVAANTFDDLSATVVLNWLKYKNQTLLPDYSIRVLTYLYFESNVTASSGTLQTDAFMYTAANDWQKIYRVNNTQYASVNRGVNFDFDALDVPNIPTYLNNFLKGDVTVMATAKVGDVQYVNYKYQTSATLVYQRVMPLAYDGINWVASNTTATNAFTYSLSANTWTGQLDNTVTYTLSSANYTAIGALGTAGTGASAAAVANFLSHNNFSIEAGSTGVAAPTDDGVRWTDNQIATAIIAILKTQFTSPTPKQKFLVTASVFGGYSTQVFGFVFDGTNFVYNPTIDPAKYTITGDDYATIARAGIGTAAASLNLEQFGDMALTGASAWTQANIDAGINTVLKLRYPAATANTTIAVTYATYSGGNIINTKSYKFDGTNWN